MLAVEHAGRPVEDMETGATRQQQPLANPVEEVLGQPVAVTVVDLPELDVPARLDLRDQAAGVPPSRRPGPESREGRPPPRRTPKTGTPFCRSRRGDRRRRRRPRERRSEGVDSGNVDAIEADAGRTGDLDVGDPPPLARERHAAKAHPASARAADPFGVEPSETSSGQTLRFPGDDDRLADPRRTGQEKERGGPWPWQSIIWRAPASTPTSSPERARGPRCSGCG